jgi:glycosyltransferase involved in cell wall biosynthesis
VVLPYQSPAVLSQWRVKQTRSLPEHGNSQLVLIQREATGHSLAQLKQWLPGWKASGGKLLYEIDDDLLDADALRARHHAGDVEATVAKVRFLAIHADAVHVSSEPLAKRFSSLNSHVRVIPNALDADLWRLTTSSQHDQGPFARLPKGPVRIGFIGTPTHDEDLDLVSEAMRSIEAKYGTAVEIEVIGGFENRTPTFGKRIVLPKKNEYPNFVRWLQERVHWDIGIIPLAATPFNESKSYLKFLEYAALDMAMVVSEISIYAQVTKHGVNCLLAKPTTEDWVEKLTLLIEDAGMRKKLAQQARLECTSQHYLEKIALLIASNLKELA